MNKKMMQVSAVTCYWVCGLWGWNPYLDTFWLGLVPWKIWWMLFWPPYLLFILKNNFRKLSLEAFKYTKNVIRNSLRICGEPKEQPLEGFSWNILFLCLC